MIYFLINNNYHLDFDLKLAKQLTSFELGLIQVPYSLNVIDKSDVFSKIHHFPNKIYLSLRHPFRILSIQKKVDHVLKPKCTDILLVHTDMDLLNQYIIQRFHQAKAKIYLLEDGTATMCVYNILPKKASFKNRFINLILRCLYKYKYTKSGLYGVETIPRMADSLFSGVIVNFGNSILREIPLYKLEQKNESFEIRYENGAIFFNQALYLFYSTEEEYILFLNDILEISRRFTPFYFKFHPSETDSFKHSITKLINEQYSNIVIIPENDIAENIVIKYPVRNAITINSTAAMNLITKGLIPIFLNNFYNNRIIDESFIVFDQFLKSINCHTPFDLSEVKPGFCAFKNIPNESVTYTIQEILNKQ